MFPTQSGAEACATISSEADKITAQYGGAKGLIDAVLGPFSPNNWKSENEASQKTRNITNIDLSNEETLKIHNACANAFAGVQTNIIDTSGCEYCQKNGCNVSNVTQVNTAENNQKCTIEALIDVLLTKTDDVKAVSTAKALQDAQGLLSGNKTTSNNCNLVNKDMSSKMYLDSMSSCANQTSMFQTNNIKGC